MLFAARSATALHRLLDALPAFAGDDRVLRRFTLVPGSEFDVDALAAIEDTGARVLPWDEACRHSFDLILTASPKGKDELARLHGTRVLLPHGAGFNKALGGEGSPRHASGLDPAYLLSDGDTLASFQALAHPDQLQRLAADSPLAASRAAVVGDPTLERLLVSADRRERYRAALGTGARTLIALTSTWGPESLLHRRPGLAARLASQLPYDAYQLALVVHPNERSRLGDLDLAERLAPALDAGVLLADAHEEWAALLVAADAVITDHGSAALYAAALGRSLIGAYDGGEELIADSPMARLLAHSPRLDASADLRTDLGADIRTDLQSALRAADSPGSYGPYAPRALADAAFAEQGRGMERLREKLYELLGLDPPSVPAEARPLPALSPPAPGPAAFAVRTDVSGERDVSGEGGEVRVERFPAHSAAPPPHTRHLAAEHGAAGERHAQSAGLLYRRAGTGPWAGLAGDAATAHSVAWTAGAWTAHALESHPGCRTAAVVLSPALCLLRTRRAPAPLSVHIEPRTEHGLVMRTDPAAVLSAVHAWLAERPARGGADDPPPHAQLDCVIADSAFRVRLSPATEAETARPC